VSFAIEPGASFGVVGANGSAKSTPLKLVAGAAKPTGGTLEVNGRVTAPLKTGAGFQPDFSGGENAGRFSSWLRPAGASAQTSQGALLHVASMHDRENPHVSPNHLEDDPMVTDPKLPVAAQ
jgi:energy-coupling factor transporter ATP-binding protein EcfA2